MNSIRQAMNMCRFTALLMIVGCLSACTSSGDTKDSLLDEAARYHAEATDIQAVLEPKIDKVDSLKTILAKQPMPGNAARLATLDSVKAAFEEWENNLVEVPGMSHEHNHKHSGKHEHRNADATLKDLPAGQMRDLQREMLNNIRQLKARFDAVVPN